jgi:hypothetical protein
MKFLSQINVNTEYTLPIVDGSNGQVLTTDGNGAVYWGSVSAGATNLNALTDVIITSPQVDQILVYRIPLGESIPVWMNITSPYATIASPTFTGIPAAPTAPTATNTTQIATTAFVKAQGYITGYTETDTLATVTTRGNTTTNTITVGGATSNYLLLTGESTLLDTKGILKWESDHNTVGLYYADGEHIDIGQAQLWYVKNTSGSTILKGQVVMATGAVGNSGNLEVQPLIADGSISGKFALGIAKNNIGVGLFGFVMTEGTIRGVDTSAYTIGTVLWANPDIPGELTSVQPTAPALKLPIAFVVSAANNGAIGVRMSQGLDLGEVNDITISSASNGQLLRYNNGIWSNWTPNFLTSFTETDPTVPSHVKAITTTNISNWNTAYGWGNHALAGYATQTWVGLNYYNEGEIDDFFSGAEPISGYNKTNWDAAYNDKINSASFNTTNGVLTLTQQDGGTVTVDLDGRYLTSDSDSQTLSWDAGGKNLTISNGNTVTLDGLATEEFVTSQGYITGYTETDTLASVTGRGATTNTSITTGPTISIQADGSSGYVASRLYLYSHNNFRGAGVFMSGTGSTWFAGTPYTDFDQNYIIARKAVANTDETAQFANALLRVNATGDVYVTRNLYANYVLGTYANFSYGNSENPTIGQIWTQSTGDDYLRKSTPAHFRSQIIDGYYLPLSGGTITTSTQYGVTINHSPVLGDFVDALLLRSTTSGQRAQIGFATVDADGDHHRASIRAYKGSGTYEGVFGIALRQTNATHVQRFTLTSAGNLTIDGQMNVSGGNSSQWNTAYSWGNHAVYGYWNINDTDTKSVQSELVRFVGDVEVQGTFTESSSIRFKENIKPLEPALGKVEQLNPVTYNKIGVVEEEIGLIAEEVAELFPEVVTYNEAGQPQGIQYQRLSVILLKAVQELTERVNKLENK